MPITIDLPAGVEKWLADRAARQGTTPAAEAATVLAQAAGLTVDEILAPFRRSIAEAGVTEAEFGELITEAIREVRANRQRAGS